MSMSQAVIEAYARASNKTISLLCIELRHSALVTPPAATGILRMVNYTYDIEITLEANAPDSPGADRIFVGHGMDAIQPKQSSEADTPYSVTLDGVAGEIQGLIFNAAQTTETCYATVRAIAFDVLTETPSLPHWALQLELKNAAYTGDTITLNMGYSNSANDQFPPRVFGPISHPGLYTN